VFATAFFAKGFRDSIEPVGGGLDAVHQVVRILSLKSVIERKHLKARKADDVRMPDRLCCDAVTTQECLDPTIGEDLIVISACATASAGGL